MYKLHFGYSKNKNYPYVLELADILMEHTIKDENLNVWHTVTFDENNENHLNIVSNIYQNNYNFRYPNIEGSNFNYVLNCCKNNGIYKKTTGYIYAPNGKKAEIAAKKFIENNKLTYSEALALLEKISNEILTDHKKLENILIYHGYLQKNNYNITSFTNKLVQYTPIRVTQIKRYISQSSYKDALDLYSEYSKGKLENNNIFVKELIYLKRLAHVQLGGNELLALLSMKNTSSLIMDNKSEFINLIEEEIKKREDSGQPHPLGILLSNVPTTEDLVRKRDTEWTTSVYLYENKIQREEQRATEENFSLAYDKCVAGSIFKIFPDQIRYCEIIEIPESQKYWGIWTCISPDTYQQEVTNKNLRLGLIDVSHHAEKSFRLMKEEMLLINSLKEIRLSPAAGYGVIYTGRTHKIDTKVFYEINLIRKNYNKKQLIGNFFLELIEEIMRDAENMLREKHGLPRIGEGWISEMRMYEILKARFKDAVHQARPKWLAPQHLDVFIESENIAFEYQGLQHYQPVEYFGGSESHTNLRKLDKRKARKCKNNGISLIYWKYDEPITNELLLKKLKAS